MYRRATYLLAAVAALGMAAACSSSSGTPGVGNQASPAGATQPALAATLQSALPSLAPVSAQAPQACAVLTKEQVGAEFGANFGAGTQAKEMAPPSASSQTRCTFEASLADGSPWTFSLIVQGYPNEAASKGEMTDNRKTKSYLGDTLWAITEMPGIGDDAISQNLLTLKNTQENLVVRKGTVIYDFQDTVITGISDSTAARGHLKGLAHLVVG